MAQIKIAKGLDIPIRGQPSGPVSPLITSGGAEPSKLTTISLNLKPFDDIKFKLLAKAGDTVAIGQPLAEDKSSPGRFFCSPAAGVIKEERRGLKRVLLDIIIDVAKDEQNHPFSPIDPNTANRDELINRLKEGGIFANIRSRPFNLLANPDKTPRTIFVKAIESAPFVPPAELQVEGHEKQFAIGLTALSKLTDSHVHVVYREGTTSKAFSNAKNVILHSAEGPHPIANSSIHIQQIDPIKSTDDVVWTLSARDVVSIGYLLSEGRYFIEQVISIAGPGIIPGKTGYFKGRLGMPISSLISGRINKDEPSRLISGDPLLGCKVGADDYLGYYHQSLTVIPENERREFLHFFRFGLNKYSFSKAYLSGHLDNRQKQYNFTTNQHGEHRAFVDASLYDKVMPLPISTMLLVKAVMAEDFELAEQLGLLAVDSEDFALPTFVCPSKIEMTEIMKNGIKQYAHDVLTG